VLIVKTIQILLDNSCNLLRPDNIHHTRLSSSGSLSRFLFFSHILLMDHQTQWIEGGDCISEITGASIGSVSSSSSISNLVVVILVFETLKAIAVILKDEMIVSISLRRQEFLVRSQEPLSCIGWKRPRSFRWHSKKPQL
jgi:hypothetical protein